MIKININNNYDIILEYRKMRSIGDICKSLNIDYSNLIRGKTSEENMHKVVQEIKLELYKFNLFMGEK